MWARMGKSMKEEIYRMTHGQIDRVIWHHIMIVNSYSRALEIRQSKNDNWIRYLNIIYALNI